MDASVAVVGPGAIGTVVAAALHDAGRTPLLFGRTARDHLELVDASGRIVVPGPVQTDPRAVTDPVDVVLLAVKATQVSASAPWLAALCRPGTVVCVLQNGVEQVRSLAPHVAGADVVPSVVWFPAETQHDGTVWLRATPRLTLPDGPGTGALLRALDGTRVEVDVAQDFTSVAWRKLLQNAVAGLMVLTGRRAGMFARDDAMFRGSPPDTGTSILADRVAGNPLEWDVRNGVVQRLGAAHGIPTPVSDVLVPLLAAASDGPG